LASCTSRQCDLQFSSETFDMFLTWSPEVRASCCARTSTTRSRFPSIGLGHRLA
jgi:hypothetical protein